MTNRTLLLLFMLLEAPQCALTRSVFEDEAKMVANTQAQMDTSALLIAYNSDLQQKVQPGLYLNHASEGILELINGAKYQLSNAVQSTQYSTVAYLCFLEPTTDGCEHFNDLGCDAVNSECESTSTSQKGSLASLCTILQDGVKHVQDDCFIVSLRESSDGKSRDDIAPWNDAVQKWFDDRNCTALMYHLKYRCYATLLKWNGVTAQEEYVDIDKLFDATFGISAVSNFNDGEPLECPSLTENDRHALTDAAQLHVETAVLNFVSTTTSLAHFGLSAADVVYEQKLFPMHHVQDKLRATLLLNLFFDGAVRPFREWCCAANLCFDYHPMDVFVDKVAAMNTFYPGGLIGMGSNAQEFARAPDIGKVHASTGIPITISDALVYNVLTDAPARMAWQAASGAAVTDIEEF